LFKNSFKIKVAFVRAYQEGSFSWLNLETCLNLSLSSEPKKCSQRKHFHYSPIDYHQIQIIHRLNWKN